MGGAISAPIKGNFTMQRNANMLKFLKKLRFCRFYGFLCKMQSPVCPPNALLSFGKNLAIYYVSSNYKALNGR